MIIYAGQEIKYSNNTLSYTDERNGREKTVILPQSISIIYNGEKLVDNVDIAFDIEIGTISLYSEEDTNTYNMIVIEEWKEGKVTLSDTATEKIWTDIKGECACIDFSDTLNNDIYKRIYVYPSEEKLSPKSVLVDDIVMVSKTYSEEQNV